MKTLTKDVCYHCGADVTFNRVQHDEHVFCCEGCKNVYEILKENQLACYYDLSPTPGPTQVTKIQQNRWDALDEPSIRSKFVTFSDGTLTQVEFYVPQMHCKSCIYLLENLHKLNSNVKHSQVDFLRQRVRIQFHEPALPLKELVALMAKIGYEPYWSLETLENSEKQQHREEWLKTGIAGIAFGIIMMLSLPEYLAWNSELYEPGLEHLFRYLSLFFGTLTFWYSASEIYHSAWKGLVNRYIHIDAPIFLSLVVTYGRSVYEIFTATGSGYLDSMSGIIFLLLLGRRLQAIQKTRIAFDKSYTSFFPLAIRVKESNRVHFQPVNELKVGQILVVGNEEIIPADSILLKGNAQIDYHFVTGESQLQEVKVGETIYAGGKQVGGNIEVSVFKPVLESYLVNLWKHNDFQRDKVNLTGFTQTAGRYFGAGILIIATLAAIFWYFYDSRQVWNVFTACLIVACPCALLLASTFTYGFAKNVLAQKGLFVKNGIDIETLAEVQTIVFDKTGTLTHPQHAKIQFVPYENAYSMEQIQSWVASLTASSVHPLSKAIFEWAKCVEYQEPEKFEEIIGKGVWAQMGQNKIQLGNATWLNAPDPGLWLQVNGKLVGKFEYHLEAYEGIESMLSNLKDYEKWILSGDKTAKPEDWNSWIPENQQVYGASPLEKLEKIEELQRQGKKVLYIGDGLNDAGALKKADFSIAVASNKTLFAPEADALIHVVNLKKLKSYLDYAKYSKRALQKIFVFSLLYNSIGLSLSVSALLHPLFAAALMMLSSLSIIGLGRLLTKTSKFPVS